MDQPQNSTVICPICPKRCEIPEGRAGDCGVRVNRGGRLFASTFGHPCALNLDPVEKKPLYHFLPGTQTFSVATIGCNLHCKHCQNWEISQAGRPEDFDGPEIDPQRIARLALDSEARSVSYTYSDPVVFYEYTLQCARAVRQAGLRNILVTAAYINTRPLAKLCRVADAANVDLKFISDRLYRENCDARLAPVLDAIHQLREAGVWLEITNLLIPTLNDSDEAIRELCQWVARELGTDTPLHFSRFHPAYRLKQLPRTPEQRMRRAREIAADCGLAYCYLGNLPGAGLADTRCPQCGETLIHRSAYHVTDKIVGPEGRCPACKHPIPGVWQ